METIYMIDRSSRSIGRSVELRKATADGIERGHQLMYGICGIDCNIPIFALCEQRIV